MDFPLWAIVIQASELGEPDDGAFVAHSHKRTFAPAILIATIKAMKETTPPYISFSKCASYPVRAGNLVRPLVDGEPAFRRICEAVYTAHRNVWVTVPFLSPRSRALRCELFSEHLG